MTIRIPRDSSPRSTTAHLTIQGRVQGVGFRDALGRQALERGIDGWVRNRRDGSVEAVIQGELPEVEALIRWAHEGPPAARVDRLESRPASPDEAAGLQPGFRCLPTV
jgi:acylphosphatase